MSVQTHSRGVLLWVDDRFGDIAADGAQAPADVWHEIFGNLSSRLYRLMDLSVEVACSYEAAEEAVRYWTGPQGAGAYVFWVVDLNLPRRRGAPAEMRWGVEVAKKLRQAGQPFVFLSANSGASETLDIHNLGTVPYHVKEHGKGIWRLPDALGVNVLNEFCNHINWLSLEDAIQRLHPSSSLVSDGKHRSAAFQFYPHFGCYREFVNRWEHRLRVDLPRTFAIRCIRADCDAFVQQCMLVLLHEWILRRPGEVKLAFGGTHDSGYIESLQQRGLLDDPAAVCCLRVNPAKTPVEQLRRVLSDSRRRMGLTILVLPNDESGDQYSELLQTHRIVALEELPHIRWGDTAAREELANRSCALAFQRAGTFNPEIPSLSLSQGWLAYPQLLVNPVNYTALLESESVAVELSDPHEVLGEHFLALRNASPEQISALAAAIDRRTPLEYRWLLTVGDEILSRLESARDVDLWVERALDLWLNASWQFPYGLGRKFAQVQCNEVQTDRWERDSGRDAWENHCYEVLAGLCRRYEETRSRGAASVRRDDLQRVCRFVAQLGYEQFLTSDTSVNWEALESLRWPHHRYPMPGAVSRRLRHLGRYLWIQPGGLDLAAALPGGRLRYRSLGDISSYYSEVLAWADDVAPHLPWGWRESVRYLSDLIARHRVADVWQAGNDARARKPRDDLWQHLLGLLRNGAPVMMVADQTLRCRPLRGTKSSAKEFLSSVDGCGKILERVRLTRHIRMWRSFRPTVDADAAPILEELNRYADALAALRSHHGPNLPDRLAAVARQMQTFYEKLIETPTDDREGARERFAAALSSCLGDDEQNYRSDDWYPEGILRFSGAPFARTASILGTRLDYVWLAMDAIGAVAASFYRYRYFDGYHSLAVINDLRNEFKDTTPRVDLATISQVIDLYVSGIQGIVAHLAWCLTMLGHQKRAARIMPPNLQFVPPPDFSPPQPDELGALVQVVEQSDAEYGVFVRGIPGKGIASDLCFHSPARGVLKLSDFTARAPRRHAAAEPAEADAVPDTPGA